MSQLNTPSSSWVAGLEYLPFADGISIKGANGFIVVTSHRGDRYAYAVPSWLAGLIVAYARRFNSPGKAFNRMLKKGDYLSVKLEG